jgi:hypothetical protein
MPSDRLKKLQERVLKTAHPDWTISEKTVAIDFDGVINQYRTSIGATEQNMTPDPPVEGAREFMWEAVKYFNVVIFTGRHASPGGLDAVRAWLQDWDFPEVEVTGIKPHARIYIDDRGYHFTGKNWPSMEFLMTFKPWNRQ